MKYLFFSLALLGSEITFCQSQKFTFKLGDEYELPRKTEDLAFFGNEKDGVVNLSLKKEELNIVRFNPKSLSKTMEQRIDLDVTKNFNSELVADFNNSSYYWLHSDWDKKNNEEILYYDKVDVNKGRIAQANIPLFTTTKIAGESKQAIGFYNYKTTEKYQYNYDADRKKLLVSYRLEPEFRNDKKNYDRIGFQVFDEHLSKIWGNEFKMPYTEAIMDNMAFSVDAKGNAYMLVKVYESDSRKEKENGMPAYHYEVFKFSKDSKNIAIAAISVGENFIKEADLVENSQHEMIIACTYSKKAKGSGTDGIFLATENNDGKIINYKNGFYEFPKAELEKFESARTQRKIEKKEDFEIQNLKVRDLLVDPDGSIFISCEEYWMEDHSYYMNNMWHYQVTYYYGDIYGSKISAGGQLEWLRKIPKRQRGSMGRGTMSFKLINDSSGFYFLYLDNIHNMNLGVDEVPKYHEDGAGGQVMVYKIDYKGNTSKELLFDTREEDIMIYPTEFSKIFGNQFIGRARIKKKLFQPVMISLR
jgi:hypothetical protein